MSEDQPGLVKRANAPSWYSTYQSQVVGQPQTCWAQEAENMPNNPESSNSQDDANEAHGNADTVKEEKKKSDLPKSEVPLANGKSAKDEDGSNEVNADPEKSLGIGLGRPMSMIELSQMKQTSDEDGTSKGTTKVLRSFSTFNWNDVYEEYKPPKKYQKPTNTKINTRLSRTYIMGTGGDKCKKCGHRLYEMEKIHANHFSYHRSCFRCLKCQRLLNLGTFISMDGQLYCKSHFLDVVSGKPGAATTISPQQPSSDHHQAPVQHAIADPPVEVSLTSITDMKSRFEASTNTHEIKFVENSRNQNLNKSHPPKEKHDIKLNTDLHFESEREGVKEATVHFKVAPTALQDERKSTSVLYTDLSKHGDNFGTGVSSLREAESDASITVAGAFAKFRDMEHQQQHVEQFKYGNKYPLTKEPPLRSEPKTLFSVESISVDGRRRPPSAVAVDSMDGPGHTNTRHSSHLYSHRVAATKDQSPASGMVIYQSSDYDDSDDEFPITGITKRLLTHWKLKEHGDSAMRETHRSAAITHSAQPSHTYSANAVVSPSDRHSNGFWSSDDASKRRNSFDLVHKENIYPQNGVTFRHKEDRNTATWVGPLDFTQSQLSKFKQLEAIAQQSVNYSSPKKAFRWDVKEVCPLHRPNTLFRQDMIWSPTKTTATDYFSPAHMTNGTHYDSEHSASDSVKEAFTTFKLLEDSSRPAAMPVKVSSRQRPPSVTTAAAAAASYHNIV